MMPQSIESQESGDVIRIRACEPRWRDCHSPDTDNHIPWKDEKQCSVIEPLKLLLSKRLLNTTHAMPKTSRPIATHVNSHNLP